MEREEGGRREEREMGRGERQKEGERLGRRDTLFLY